MPAILNKMIVFILIGEKHMSQAAIEAYCHYLLLFNRLLLEFPHLQKKINDSVDGLYAEPQYRNFHKKVLPDIGNFLLLLSFSDKQFTVRRLIHAMLQEFKAREVFWFFESPQTKETMKSDIYKLLEGDENITKYLENKTERKEEAEERIQLLMSRLEEKFWKSFSQEFFFEDDVDFSDEFFQSKKPLFKTKKEESTWEKLIALYEEVKRSKRLLKFTEEDSYDSYFNNYYNNNRLMLFERCTDDTKAKLMSHLYTNKQGILLFTMTACKRFINKDFLQKLTANNGLIEEKDSLDLINYMREAKERIHSFSAMMNEIGFGDFYNEKEK